MPRPVDYQRKHCMTRFTPLPVRFQISWSEAWDASGRTCGCRFGYGSGFLANLGRPARESACECDRQNDVQLGAVMSLLAVLLAEAIGDPKNRIAELAGQLVMIGL